MTGALDSTALNTASRLMAKFGKAMTLTRRPGTYDPTTGMVSDTAPQVVTLNGLPDSTYRKLGQTYGSELIQSGDLDVLVAAKGLTLTPAPGDELSWGPEIYKVQLVKPTYSGEQVATYNLLVRR